MSLLGISSFPTQRVSRDECFGMVSKSCENLHHALKISNFDFGPLFTAIRGASNLVQVATDCAHFCNAPLERQKFLRRKWRQVSQMGADEKGDIGCGTDFPNLCTIAQ